MEPKYYNILFLYKISHLLPSYDSKILNCFFIFVWTAFASGVIITSTILNNPISDGNPMIVNGTGFADVLAGYGAYYDHNMLAILAIPVANYAARVTQIVQVNKLRYPQGREGSGG